MEKQPNDVIAEAFRERLKTVAGFKCVPSPLPMKNSRGAVVYYLFVEEDGLAALAIAWAGPALTHGPARCTSLERRHS